MAGHMRSEGSWPKRWYFYMILHMPYLRPIFCCEASLCPAAMVGLPLKSLYERKWEERRESTRGRGTERPYR